MKKANLLNYFLISVLSVFVCSCAGNNPVIKCYNGQFKGTTEDGVISFKGIPYAKPPVGKLRWKAPVAVDADDTVYEAYKFGKSSIQTKSYSEQASYNVIGEDCLTLNIWTKDLSKKNKPIMFYVHGGAFGWGGTSDPLYNGKFIIREHNDVIVVTCNYRVNLMGFADFSKVPGGENYPDAGYLGVLDIIQGLKWVKQNAESFGGDPDNVTIFGESAGGGIVSILMTVKEAQGLFNRVIAESGCLNFTYTHKDFERRGQTDLLLKLTGAKNMDDLIAIPESKLIELYSQTNESGNQLANLHGLPLRGNDSIIPEDPYEAMAQGMSKDVDLIIGTNKDENRYFIDEIGGKPLAECTEDEFENYEIAKLAIFSLTFGKKHFNKALEAAETEEEKKQFYEFLKMKDDLKIQIDEEYANEIGDSNITELLSSLWRNVELSNETSFRAPAMETAYLHAKNGGKTYMYYFGKESDTFEWIGCPHAAELSYVFHNLEDEQFSGKIDKGLSDKLCSAWVNFAKTGNPSSSKVEWNQYTPENRETLIVNNDCTIKMENDPKKKERELLHYTVKHFIF
ncbi:MAG: carboxylesterase/lipase family protein [Treponema sp.]|nr:carboxylesterase/lipase family protein [Candidatus Treponema merdequi]